jgi:Nup85 Nucleoporin
LADRCVEPLNQHDNFMASRYAFRGNAVGALQKLNNYDSWAECHMCEIFSRCGAIESPSLYPLGKLGDDERFHLLPLHEADFRQVLTYKFACQVGFGPGKVASRPVDLDIASLKLALKYLEHVDRSMTKTHRKNETLKTIWNQSKYLAAAILDHFPLSSERVARRLFHDVSIENKSAKLSIARKQIERWLRIGAYQNALNWVELSEDPELAQNVFERAVESFADKSGPGITFDVESAGASLSESNKATLELFVVRNKLNGAQRKLLENKGDWFHERDEAARVMVQIISTVPSRFRIKLLRAVLLFRLDLPESCKKLAMLNVSECTSLMRVLSAHTTGINRSSIGYENVENTDSETPVKELRAVLSVMLAEAVQRGAF